MKCQRTASETSIEAPTATMPYTVPPPGVRLPKASVSTAEMTGSSTTIHAWVTNQFGAIFAASATASPPSDQSRPTT